jgi:hypothetical protein
MKDFSLKDSIYAGLIAGVIMMMLEMIMVPLFLGGSPWGPPRMMAGILLGSDVVPPPATFDLGVMMAGLGVHLIMSIIFALILDAIVNNMSFIWALVVGAVFGYLLYLVNFYLIAEAMFPWFLNATNWVTAFAHISFGIGAAWAYKGLTRHHAPAEDREHERGYRYSKEHG